MASLHAAVFPDGWSEADFLAWLARPEGFAMIEVREREAVAMGLAIGTGVDAELLTIATRPALRREGLGRSILAALDAEAKKRGLGRWVLEVARNNAPGLGLYKSAGFVEIAVRKAYYSQPKGRVDALVLSRRVGLAGGHGGT
jgi:ribosomal-protein-alanine N-acetyltransferase